ncbi:hypothetical protein EDB89DRAFT_1906765 [Lactarius sanguifluus]|nr:hypothetical protein EDB89DRAFT_1906765 [Lactarius sanguifluus]
MSNPSKSFLHSDDQQAGQVQKVKKVIQVQSYLSYNILYHILVIYLSHMMYYSASGSGWQWQGWGHDVARVAPCYGGVRGLAPRVGGGCGTTAGLVWGRWSDVGGGEVAAAAVSMQQTCGRQAKVALGEDTAMSCDS